MKKLLYYIAVLFLLIGFQAHAQDFPKVDAAVRNYPKSFSKSEDLAAKINTDFSREDEKVRAAYTWIALNVAYNVKEYFAQVGERRVAYSFKSEAEMQQKKKELNDDLIKKTVCSKLAVCQGYAALFQDVCLRMGIPCEVVTGTSKVLLTNIGKLPGASDHAWNVVKTDGNWHLIDVTWAAGSLDGTTRKFNFGFSGGYFFTDPEVFFLNHFPDDKKWLFIDKSEKDFADLPLYFRGYTTASYTIVTPEIGLIQDVKSKVIPFEIMDLPLGTKVGYVFSNENKLVEVDVIRKGDTASFDVLLSDRSRGYLTIFIDNHSVAAYRLGS